MLPRPVHPERAVADRLVVVGLVVRRAGDGRDGAQRGVRGAQLELAVRRRERDLQRVRVGGVDAGQRRGTAVLHLREARHLVEVVGDVGGRRLGRGPLPAALEGRGVDRLAVGERRSRLQRERPLRAVGVRRPRRRHAVVGVAVPAYLDQTGEQRLGDQEALALLGVVRVDRGRLDDAEPERPAWSAGHRRLVRSVRERVGDGSGVRRRDRLVAALGTTAQQQAHGGHQRHGG